MYMGVKRLPEIADALIAAGSDGGEPAAAVERGPRPRQRTVTATLAELPARRRAGIAPAGDHPRRPVAARRETIAWLERPPLFGRRGRRHPGAGAGERPRGDARARSAPR